MLLLYILNKKNTQILTVICLLCSTILDAQTYTVTASYPQFGISPCTTYKVELQGSCGTDFVACCASSGLSLPSVGKVYTWNGTHLVTTGTNSSGNAYQELLPDGGTPPCLSPPVSEICNNGIDDDGNGLIDCADSACPACNLACTDGVVLLSQKVDTKVGLGASKIPSITNLDIPTGDKRAVFVLVNFEREHCQSGDNCTNSNTSGIGLGDNFACPTYLSGIYQITANFTGTGGTVSYENPLTAPEGDLRFGYQAGYPTPPSPNPLATFYSRESYFIAIYENDINTILGGSSAGTIDITLPNVVAPLDDADEAIMYAFVFENVEQNNFGIVRSGVNTSLDNITSSIGGVAGNFSIADTDLDNTQEPDEAEDGLLVLGVSGLGGSHNGGFNNIAGYTKIAENKITNTGGHFTTHNEADGFSATVFFRNGPSSGMINSVTIQSSASSGITANGGMLFVFTIESAACSLVEICNNGIDDDGDGLIDCDDTECKLPAPEVIIMD